MSEDDPDARRLSDLEERLKKARGQRTEQPRPSEHYSQLGIAFRLLSEMMKGPARGLPRRVVAGGPSHQAGDHSCSRMA